MHRVHEYNGDIWRRIYHMEAGRYQKRPPQIYYSQSSVYEDQVCSQSLSASGSTIHSPVSIINLKASRSAPNLPFFTLPQQVYTALMQPIHILMCWEVCIPPNISCNYHKSFQEAWFAIGPSDLLGLFSRIPLPLQKKAVVYMLDNICCWLLLMNDSLRRTVRFLRERPAVED